MLFDYKLGSHTYEFQKIPQTWINTRLKSSSSHILFKIYNNKYDSSILNLQGLEGLKFE